MAADPATEVRIEGLVGAMTVEEKAGFLAGRDLWHTVPNERLGIPSMRVTDGPSGARGTQYSGGPPSACFLSGTALAATWDVDLVRALGGELAAEAKAKGANVLLAPTINLHRHPLGGRHFECMSEDPHLTSRVAVAYIEGLQGGGVGCCVKHFVANDVEFERMTISSEVPERALRELYLAPFEAAMVEAGAWSTMAAYNRLYGTYCAEQPWLLTELIRDEWGWDGAVISDWWATHSTAASANAGLDLEMPGPALWYGEKLATAVAAGEVEEKVLDERVRNLLRLLARTGVLDADADEGRRTERSDDTVERTALLRRAAAESVVLLRNEGKVLPLDPVALRGATVAVIGPNAAVGHIQGGGSATVTPYRAVSPLAALVEALGDEVTVLHEPGVVATRGTPRIPPDSLRPPDAAGAEAGADGAIGFAAEFFAGTDLAAGEPVARRVVKQMPFVWQGAPAAGVDPGPGGWCVRLSADYLPTASGPHGFRVRATGGVRCFVDGVLHIDDWDDTAGTGARHVATADLVDGQPARLVIEYRPSGGRANVDVRCAPPVPEDLLERAVAAASAADIAVLVMGLDSDWETEGRDRETWDLPGGQDGLVEAVAAANPRTVVVVNSGSPVAMPWADKAPALLQLFYAGQEAGHGLADVLTGVVNPSGRLPTTFPLRIEDTPSHLSYPGEFGRADYGEGLFMGYRGFDARRVVPRFAFGHGLSYTTFVYDAVWADSDDPDLVRVEVDVRNTGERDGAEVVQCYVSPIQPRVARPTKELKAFRRVEVAAGASATVHFDLDARAFSYWDPAAHDWRADPGSYDLLIGGSSDALGAAVRIVRP